MNHSTTVRRACSPINSSRRNTMTPNPRIRSYVWHYFERISRDTAKCRVCRDELEMIRGSSSPLIWHLQKFHGLRDRTVVSLDSLPTLAEYNGQTNMAFRHWAAGWFRPDGDVQRCEMCAVTFPYGQEGPMVQHLRVVHWKACGRFFRDFVRENIRDPSADDPSDEQSTVKQDTDTSVSDEFRPNSGEYEPRSFDGLDNNSGDCEPFGINSSDGVSIGEETMGGNEIPQYKTTFNLPDGTEIEGLVVGSADNYFETARSENVINLSHHYHDESQTVFPIIPEDRSSWNVQKVVIKDESDELECGEVDPQVAIVDPQAPIVKSEVDIVDAQVANVDPQDAIVDPQAPIVKSEVGIVVFSNADSYFETARSQNVINLSHHYHDESRTAFPIIPEDQSAWNVQKVVIKDESDKLEYGEVDPQVAIVDPQAPIVKSEVDIVDAQVANVDPQVPIVDNRRKFGHQYSRKAKRKLNASSKRTKPKTRKSMRLRTKLRNKAARTELEDLDLNELDIQVPLQDVPN